VSAKSYEDVPFDAITFAEGITDGLEAGTLAGTSPEPEPGPDTAPASDRPDHHSILDTPVVPPASSAPKLTPLGRKLEAMYAAAGMMVFPMDQQLGMVISTQGPECAKALDDLAKADPAVKRALEKMLATSAWSTVVMAHLPILVAAGTKYVPELKRRYQAHTAAAAGGDATL